MDFEEAVSKILRNAEGHAEALSVDLKRQRRVLADVLTGATKVISG